jgi:hypothetical protein
MSRPDRQRYKTKNWRDYNAALKQRGSLTIWLDPSCNGKRCRVASTVVSRHGRQQVFSATSIQTAALFQQKLSRRLIVQ